MALTERLAQAEADQDVLHALGDPERGPVAARVAVIVAHPDDETIGCGAQLPRLKEATVVVVTDGAPRDLKDARKNGFSNAVTYAARRVAELSSALALAQVDPRDLLVLRHPDQQAAFGLVDIARTIHHVLAQRQIRTVLTHAYEGGHPDHDATAFAVHAAAALHRRRGCFISLIEMPFYRQDATHGRVRGFVPSRDQVETTIELDERQRRLKRLMMDAYVSQRETLRSFHLDVERFRPAPAYNFAVLPNGGQLFYERNDWGMSGDRWLTLARAAIRELGLGEHAWL